MRLCPTLDFDDAALLADHQQLLLPIDVVKRRRQLLQPNVEASHWRMPPNLPSRLK
jgi:hypothetical protein